MVVETFPVWGKIFDESGPAHRLQLETWAEYRKTGRFYDPISRTYFRAVKKLKRRPEEVMDK